MSHLNIQGSCKIDGCLVISHCTCAISPVLQIPRDSGLQYAPEITGLPAVPRGSRYRRTLEGHWYPDKLWGLPILLVGSQMCLLLISHSHKTHFCLCIGDLLFETMAGPPVWDNARGTLSGMFANWLEVFSMLPSPCCGIWTPLHHLLCVSSLGEQSEKGWEKCLNSLQWLSRLWWDYQTIQELKQRVGTRQYLLCFSPQSDCISFWVCLLIQIPLALSVIEWGKNPITVGKEKITQYFRFVSVVLLKPPNRRQQMKGVADHFCKEITEARASGHTTPTAKSRRKTVIPSA